jgi:Domain of unknown function (DUF222)
LELYPQPGFFRLAGASHTTKIENMFDSPPPDGASLTRADDATMIAAITGWTRAEAAASAHRLAAIAELVRRRAVGSARGGNWSCDNWDAMAAEVAAAQGVSHRMASGQMYLASALRNRLPQVAALFAAGMISARLAAAIVWRTDAIKDPETPRLVDTSLAQDATRYGPLSATKTDQAIDAIVDRYDPGALRHTRASARSRDVVIELANDESGTAALYGRLYSTDAATLNRRLTQMAHDVCDDDPRTLSQRRPDALGALGAGAQRLNCTCDKPDCPARTERDERASAVVIHVVAEAASLHSPPDPHMSGTVASRPLTPGMTVEEALAPDPEPDPIEKRRAAMITGGGTVPAPLLADLVRHGAQLRVLRQFGDDAAAESGYRPSAALDAFVRSRDMTCRFPNCDRPAQYCDVDHSIPYPLGATHPSNLKCLCRKHHQTITFELGETRLVETCCCMPGAGLPTRTAPRDIGTGAPDHKDTQRGSGGSGLHFALALERYLCKSHRQRWRQPLQIPPCLPPCRHHNDRVSTQHGMKGALGEFFGCHWPQPLRKFEEFLVAEAVEPPVLAACHQRGPDHARTKHRHPHAVALGLHPQRLRDSDDGVFGGGVAPHTRTGNETGHRGGVHNVAGVLSDHDRIDRLDAVDHTAQVHVEDVVPVIERVGVDFTANPDAGVVEQVVDPPGLLHRLGDGALKRWVAAHIEFDRVRLSGTTVEALRQLLRRADLTIGDPDLGALVDQLGRQRGADAGRPAGNECDLARHARRHCGRIIPRLRK